MIADGLGLHARYDRRQRGGVRVLDGLHAAEMFQQAARGARAYAGNLEQLS